MIIRHQNNYVYIYPFLTEPSEYSESFEARLAVTGKLEIFKKEPVGIRFNFSNLIVDLEKAEQLKTALTHAMEILRELRALSALPAEPEAQGLEVRARYQSGNKAYIAEILDIQGDEILYRPQSTKSGNIEPPHRATANYFQANYPTRLPDLTTTDPACAVCHTSLINEMSKWWRNDDIDTEICLSCWAALPEDARLNSKQYYYELVQREGVDAMAKIKTRTGEVKV
jgi:hypothetical protein